MADIISIVPQIVQKRTTEIAHEAIQFFEAISGEPKPDFSDDPDTELQQVIDDCNYWSQKLAEVTNNG